VVKTPAPQSRSIGALLESTQVGAAMVHGAGRVEPVELQVDLDPLAVPAQQREQRVVAGQLDPVGVEQDPHDGASHERVEQLGQLRVQGRLAAGEHEHVEPAALPPEPGVDIRQHLCERHDPGRGRAGVGEARGAAQVALGDDVLDEDAGVLGVQLGQAVRVGLRHRQPVAPVVGGVLLGRRGPSLEMAQDLDRLVVEGADQAVLRAAALQPHPAGPVDREPPRQPPDLLQRTHRVGLVTGRAERADVAMDPHVSQRHTGAVHRPTRSGTGSA
jgi:hypothetical protein